MSTTPISLGGSVADPHGQAALLLVESLIHSLVNAGSLSVEDAITSIEVARDAQLALLEANRAPEASTQLLEHILRSLETDLPPDAPHR